MHVCPWHSCYSDVCPWDIKWCGTRFSGCGDRILCWKGKKKKINLQFEKPWMDYNETKCLNVFELCWDFSFMSLQNVEDSKAFFKRKIDFLTKQIEKIQPALQEKHAMKQGNFLISVHHHTMWHYTGFKHCMSQNSGWVGGGWNTYFIQWHACFWTFYFFLQLKWNYPKN